MMRMIRALSQASFSRVQSEEHTLAIFFLFNFFTWIFVITLSLSLLFFRLRDMNFKKTHSLKTRFLLTTLLFFLVFIGIAGN